MKPRLATDAVAARLRRNWRSRLIADDDYVRRPKESGYRAIHLVVLRDGRRIEIPASDALAGSLGAVSGGDTARLGLGLKFGLGPDDLREYYWLMAEVMAAREEAKLVDEGVLSQLAKLHAQMRRYFSRHRHES